MARGHPENPGQPGLLEAIQYGAEYDWFAAQLDDTTTGGFR